MKKPERIERAAPENPYLAARREWNERYGDYIKAAHNWRLAAIGSIGVALICSGGMAALALQQKVVPYAVEFNEHHEPVRVTRADVMAHPSSNQIKAALRLWIMGARTVFLDRRALQDMIITTYAMTAPGSLAYGSLSDYQKTNDPYQVSQQNTVEVAVNAVMQLSEETWRIEWTETRRQLSGKILDSKIWQATATVSIIPPTEESQVLLNPVGVYVNNFSWAQRI